MYIFLCGRLRYGCIKEYTLLFLHALESHLRASKLQAGRGGEFAICPPSGAIALLGISSAAPPKVSLRSKGRGTYA